jgi:hypothetical protein
MELVDFIIAAKIGGYASGSEALATSFEDGAKGFVFESNGYRYVDRYYGFNPFSGTEFVFDSSGKLIWLMNYYGKVGAASSKPSVVYQILKDAMLKIDREFPFRGPSKLIKNDYIYENTQSGSIDRFQGKEHISKNGIELYSLNYHGGLMV